MEGYILFMFSLISCSLQVHGANFLVLGDWGGLPIPPYTTQVEESTAKQMAATAELKNSQHVLALGDNFYYTGVKNEYDSRFNETYSDVFNQPSLQIPWYVVAGNHDHYGNVSGEIGYQRHSKFWKFPNLWYSKQFIFKDTNRTLKVVMIDTILLCGNTLHDYDHGQPTDRSIFRETNGMFEKLQTTEGPEDTFLAEDQWAWIENELKTSQDDYLLVGGHFPVWSIAEHGPTQCLVDRLKPLLEKYDVSAYLCGHDHNLQHIKEDNSSVHYFVIGSANFINTSQAHADKVPEDYLKFFWADATRMGGFGSVDVTDESLVVTLIDSLGADLHQQDISPRKPSNRYFM